MPRQASPMPASDPADREPTPKEQWGQWLDAELTARNISNPEFATMLNRPGYDATQVWRWRTGKGGASLEAALRIAEVLDVAPVIALRAAGQDSYAQLLEDVVNGRKNPGAPTDPARATASELVAGLPPEYAHQIAEGYVADVVRAKQYAQWQADEARRKLGLDDSGSASRGA